MTLQPLTQLMAAWLTLGLLMLLLWLLQRRTDDAGVVDVGWTLGLGATALFYAATGGGDHARRLLLGLLVALWSCRLGWYLLRDRVIPEAAVLGCAGRRLMCRRVIRPSPASEAL